MAAMVEKLGSEAHSHAIEFEYIHDADLALNDQIMASMPEGSVLVNATGMGKDTPGSPITGAGRFPPNGIAWEINYREELDFWRQVMAQKDALNLRVEDGWLYFLHGWTQVIAEVLHIELDAPAFDRLEAIAAELRPPLAYKPLSSSRRMT
jgi:shikimate 5-dehydrogenase